MGECGKWHTRGAEFRVSGAPEGGLCSVSMPRRKEAELKRSRMVQVDDPARLVITLNNKFDNNFDNNFHRQQLLTFSL